MSIYTPDLWVVVEIDYDGEITKKVLASWYGGYLGSDSWKLSSGITKVTEYADRYEFLNHSGSVYICYKTVWGMSGYTSGVYNDLFSRAEALPNTQVRLCNEFEEIDND